MQASPLQFRRYVTEGLHLDLAPGYDDPDRQLSDDLEDAFAVDVEPLAFPRTDRPGDLRLTVRLNDGAESWPFYRARIVVRGTFDLMDPEPPPPEELDRYFVLTAATVLYGAARALFTQLTAASPYPRIMLPVVTFADDVDELLGNATIGE